ncbi:MAG: DUF4199 domain-containing protein [Chitinophagales bacterium]
MEKKQTHIVYGFITGIIMVIVSLVLYLTGIMFKGNYISMLSMVPFLIGIILNGMAYSKANEGFVTFGNVFGSCFKLSMIVTIVLVVWNIIALFALPEMKTKIMEMSREAMAKNPKVTDEQIEMSVNMMKKYWNVFAIGGVIFSTLFWGAIFSLIGSAISKKNGERPGVSQF